MVATTLRDPSTSYGTSMNPPQSSLSFKLGPSSLSRTQTSVNIGAETPPPGRTPPNASNPPLAATFDRTSPEKGDLGTPIDPAGVNSLIQMEVDEETKRSATSASITHHIPPPTAGRSQTNMSASFTPSTTIFRSDTMPAPYVPAPYTPYTPASAWHPASRPLPSSSNHYPNVMHRQPVIPSSQPTTTSADNPFNFPTTVSLTYDSFWSSHSASAALRSSHGSPPNMTGGFRASSIAVADMPGPSTYQAVRGERQPPMARATAGREG
ncbi:hypothetical protein DXG03_001853 [Asterophora parasitica]|uniref:Uncharacterized protein n=1 Tax=Asterophora parasitica TaxID=117018 RepID=A0A9P7G4H9_9AGAR|nr:hypothetical protein DXG03_001853 [Asterophora parasitica]